MGSFDCGFFLSCSFLPGTAIQPHVFSSQDFHDTMLEMERLKELNRKALIIQRVMKGFKYRYCTTNLHMFLFHPKSDHDVTLIRLLNVSAGDSSSGNERVLWSSRSTGEDTEAGSSFKW